jgi:anti-sigma B factor antagonist
MTFKPFFGTKLPPMFRYYLVGKTLVICVEGDLLGQGIETQIQHLAFCFCPKLSKNILIDLSKLNHINSTGLNLLLKILTKVRGEGGEILLVKPHEKVTRLLATTKLDKIFKMRDSTAKALNELLTD